VNRKVVTIILSITLLIIGGIILVERLNPSGFSNGIVAKGEDSIKTSLGDEFLIKYETRNFPDYETTVTIMDAPLKKYLCSYLKEYDYEKPKYLIHIDSPTLRCYEIEHSLIYKVNFGQFKGVSVGSIENEKIEDNTDLIVISKELVGKKEWRWVKACAKFLLKSGDDDIRKIIGRYALDQFTQEELDLNKTSIYKKADMQIFAKKVVE